ncbi:MAG: NAD(+)/NADH kinase [Oscillospiraceae bacterium]|nr:NAD(+)/NADH kinase [Oscillospiraceae bacterium]
MKHIVLCPNVQRDADFSCTLRAKTMLEEAGCQVTVSPLYGEEDGLFPPIPLGEALEGADLLVTLGGDGTILRIAPLIMEHMVPLVGVNLGHKGFLAELDGESIEMLLQAAAGKFELVPRMMLDVEIRRGGEIVFSDTGLNEAVVSGVVQNIRLAALGDGQQILDFSGDGIIVSSPTGSTAYSMSAGGPLVEPGAETIILTPICAHMLAARSFVLTPERVVTVIPADLGPERRGILSVDGRGMTNLQDGDQIIVKKSAHKLLMADLGTKSFYETAFEKLGGRT